MLFLLFCMLVMLQYLHVRAFILLFVRCASAPEVSIQCQVEMEGIPCQPGCLLHGSEGVMRAHTTGEAYSIQSLWRSLSWGWQVLQRKHRLFGRQPHAKVVVSCIQAPMSGPQYTACSKQWPSSTPSSLARGPI